MPHSPALVRRKLPSTFKDPQPPPDPPSPGHAGAAATAGTAGTEGSVDAPRSPGGYSVDEIEAQIAALSASQEKAIAERLAALDALEKPAASVPTAAKSQAKKKTQVKKACEDWGDDGEDAVLAALAKKQKAMLSETGAAEQALEQQLEGLEDVLARRESSANSASSAAATPKASDDGGHNMYPIRLCSACNA